MAVINVTEPTNKEIEWLSTHIGPRLSYLPHHVGGTGWRFKRNYSDKRKWTLEFDDDKMASYYILKFK